MSSGVPVRLARKVTARAGNACEYCRLPQRTQEATFHIDHILPRVDGGKTELNNLALACVSCSLKKAARTLVPDAKLNKQVRIFHPRKDNWTDHFRWTPAWKVMGKTAIGRATIDALGMNRPAIIRIRRIWEMVGEFDPA
jgi:5-methylcytosine-specific restriction endonuclease McrA